MWRKANSQFAACTVFYSPGRHSGSPHECTSATTCPEALAITPDETVIDGNVGLDESGYGRADTRADEIGIWFRRIRDSLRHRCSKLGMLVEIVPGRPADSERLVRALSANIRKYVRSPRRWSLRSTPDPAEPIALQLIGRLLALPVESFCADHGFRYKRNPGNPA